MKAATSQATEPKIDEDGYIWVLGRVDDVMNVSGHRISTAEVESAFVDHPSVAEAAVVGAADDITGQAIVGYVILRGAAAEELARQMTEDSQPASASEPNRRCWHPSRCFRCTRRGAAPACGCQARADSPTQASYAGAPTCRRPAAARSCGVC